MKISKRMEKFAPLSGILYYCSGLRFAKFLALLSMTSLITNAVVASDIRSLSVENVCSTNINDAIKASKALLSQQLVTSVEAYTGSATSVEIVGGIESVLKEMDSRTETYTSAYLLDYEYIIKKNSQYKICIDANAKGDREKAIADIEWEKTIRDLPNIDSLVKAREISREEFYRYDRKPRRIE